MRNTVTLFMRLLRHVLRSPDTIITVVVLPAAMMLLFVYVFGGALSSSLGSDISYVNYQMPGILLMAIAFGISYTALRLYNDMQKGLFARFHSMPIGRSSVLWAHVLVSLASTLFTLLIIFLLALVIGFRTSAGIVTWLAVIGILILFTLALTWLAVIPGITAKSMDGAIAFGYPLAFLPFFSSAFVPTETMPLVLRVFAENQPVTPIVNTLRALLNSEPVGNEIWVALAWCIGITFVAYLLAIRAYRRMA